MPLLIAEYRSPAAPWQPWSHGTHRAAMERTGFCDQRWPVQHACEKQAERDPHKQPICVMMIVIVSIIFSMPNTCFRICAYQKLLLTSPQHSIHACIRSLIRCSCIHKNAMSTAGPNDACHMHEKCSMCLRIGSHNCNRSPARIRSGGLQFPLGHTLHTQYCQFDPVQIC